MTEQPTPTTAQIDDMRDVLKDRFPAATTAPEANILRKIENTWRGGVAGFLADNYGK
ncbi:hypothetical protein [Amycolatopsis sp. NPDC004378]